MYIEKYNTVFMFFLILQKCYYPFVDGFPYSLGPEWDCKECQRAAREEPSAKKIVANRRHPTLSHLSRVTLRRKYFREKYDCGIFENIESSYIPINARNMWKFFLRNL